MPIQQDPAILGAIRTRGQSKDEITKILNKETKPAISDRAEALLRNVSSASRGRGLTFETGQDIFNQRRAAMVQPQIDAFNLAQQTIDAGGKDTQAIMETFGKFADNPEDMARLFAAAESDPEEITPQNAASFAARKAQELGLRSVKKMQAENQQMFGQARLAAAEAKTGQESAGGVSWLRGAAPAATAPQGSLPTDESLVQTGGALLPPPVSGGAQPDQTMFENAPVSQLKNINGIRVDVSKFPQGLASVQSYKDDAELRKEINAHNKQKDVVDAVYAPARAAQGFIDKLDEAGRAVQRLESAGKSTGTVQGPTGTLLNNPDIETLNNVESAVAMSARVPGTGAVSNFDAEQLLRQSPGASRSMEYNKLWIANRRAQLENTKDYAQFYNWYISAFGPASAFEAERVWEEFRKQNPMIDVNEQGLPVRLPGYDADWRQWVAGQGGQSQGGGAKDISEMSLEELEAERQKLLGR